MKTTTKTQTKTATHTPNPRPLYHHKTDGGAEYLTDKFTLCPNGDKEGIFEGANFIVRIDGDITKDAELTVANAPLYDAAPDLLAALEKLLTASEILDGQEYPPDAADVDYFLQSAKQARAAIARAKGVTP